MLFSKYNYNILGPNICIKLVFKNIIFYVFIFRYFNISKLKIIGIILYQI